MGDLMGGVRKHAKSMEMSHRAALTKAFAALYRNPGDPDGVHRHEAGGVDNSIFDNMPTTPSYGLQKVKLQVFEFTHWGEVLTDAVDAAKHDWVESAVGSGTALQLITTELGGAAQFVTGAVNGNYYAYQAYQKLAKGQQSRDFFFEATVNISDTNNGAFFVGLCETIAAGNLLDNRLNCLGFFNYYNGRVVGCETRVAGVAEQSSFNTSFPQGEDISLGLRYYSEVQHVIFFVDHDSETTRLMVRDAPAVMMPISIGFKNASAGARTIKIKKLVLGVAID